jgi:CheY-like chemotaxis protein
MNARPVVLIVEDDDDDLFLLERELAKVVAAVVKPLRDGRAIIDYLDGHGAFSDRLLHPLPDIVFLDLKIPLVNGHEVMTWIRSRRELDGLRVYVLTGSDEPRDRARIEELGAAGYIVKPLLAPQLRELLG